MLGDTDLYLLDTILPPTGSKWRSWVQPQQPAAACSSYQWLDRAAVSGEWWSEGTAPTTTLQQTRPAAGTQTTLWTERRNKQNYRAVFTSRTACLCALKNSRDITLSCKGRMEYVAITSWPFLPFVYNGFLYGYPLVTMTAMNMYWNPDTANTLVSSMLGRFAAPATVELSGANLQNKVQAL